MIHEGYAQHFCSIPVPDSFWVLDSRLHELAHVKNRDILVRWKSALHGWKRELGKGGQAQTSSVFVSRTEKGPIAS